VALGGAGLLAGSALCLGLMADPEGGRTLYYVGPLFLFVAALYLAPAFIGGLGLLRGAVWARVVIGALSALLLLAIPVGTLLGGFGLWALARSPPPAKPAPSPRTPGPPSRAPGLLVAMAAVGCGFVVVLGAGFRLHHQTPPGLLGPGFYPAIVALAAIVAFVIVKRPFAEFPSARGLNPVELHRLRTRMHAEREAWEVERRRRIAELSADPTRRKYAARIEAGEAWNDAQIAYDLDPDATATCRHLRPVESAMRAAGLEVRLIAPPQVRAPCRIDEPALWSQFERPRSVSYLEMFLGGRAAEDDPVAYLRCEACQATIDVLHPDQTREGTPAFPG